MDELKSQFNCHSQINKSKIIVARKQQRTEAEVEVGR